VFPESLVVMPIELKAVRKSYGAHGVLKGIDLTIKDGEICVFVGPSGCGKSTLLRMIAGLEDITDGEILIDGLVVNDLEPSARKLAMVFQSYALYPHMSVAGNMSFGLRMTGTSRLETEARVAEAARILKLEALMRRKPSQLSGGQRQRVAIGRAIVRKPRAFLFDEPLSNLDAELRGQMRVEIAKLHRDLGATMIYVTHDQVEAMTLGHRIVVLNGGVIAQVGTPETLYADPDNLFVAGFIGSPQMNFLAAQISSDGTMITWQGGAAFAVPTGLALQPGQNLKLGIRPDRLGETGDITANLVLDIVENLGNARIAHGITRDGQRMIMEYRGAVALRPGQSFDARFASADLLIFNEDGVRLRPSIQGNKP
jgi:lactose/L-arabinose transport system ATP-binding protein